MSVNPGFGGQKFIPGTLEKLRQARERIEASGRAIRLEVDGGVTADNIGAIAAAGADTFLAGSAIFHAKDYPAEIAAMRKVIGWPDGTKKKSRRQEGGTGINVVGDARGKTPWIGACRRESPPGSSQTSHRQVPRQRGTHANHQVRPGTCRLVPAARLNLPTVSFRFAVRIAAAAGWIEPARACSAIAPARPGRAATPHRGPVRRPASDCRPSTSDAMCAKAVLLHACRCPPVARATMALPHA